MNRYDPVNDKRLCYKKLEESRMKFNEIVYFINFIFSLSIVVIFLFLIFRLLFNMTNCLTEYYDPLFSYGSRMAIVIVLSLLITLICAFILFSKRSLFIDEKMGFIIPIFASLIILVVGILGTVECTKCYRDMYYNDYVVYSGTCTGYGGSRSYAALNDANSTKVYGNSFPNGEYDVNITYAKRTKRCLSIDYKKTESDSLSN